LSDRGYVYFEHTADVGIRAWGPTMGDAFAEAALGLVANMVDVSQAKVVGEARIEVEAESLERLLFHFLDDVLDLFYTKLWVIREVDVRLEGDKRLVATLKGETYDEARHGHVHEIKAMTFHEMRITREPPEVRVIVDI
jgi:SHS2 domain-containing protein